MTAKSAQVLHFSLCVDDLERSIAFYGEAFGFTPSLAATDLCDAFGRLLGIRDVSARLAQLSHETRSEVIELIAVAGVQGSGGGPVPLAHLAFKVPDLPEALADMVRYGARPLGETVTFAEGRSAYCKEPGGSVFELEELF